jgi:hypothetical protein
MTAEEAYRKSIEISRTVGYQVRVRVGWGEQKSFVGDWWSLRPLEEVKAEFKYTYNSTRIRELVYDSASGELWAECQLYSADGRWLRQETRKGKTVTVVA